jgi:hypothetical protein
VRTAERQQSIVKVAVYDNTVAESAQLIALALSLVVLLITVVT